LGKKFSFGSFFLLFSFQRHDSTALFFSINATPHEESWLSQQFSSIQGVPQLYFNNTIIPQAETVNLL